MIDRASVLAKQVLDCDHFTQEEKEKILSIYDEVEEYYPIAVANHFQKLNDFKTFRQHLKINDAFLWKITHKGHEFFHNLQAIFHGWDVKMHLKNVRNAL